MQKPGVSPEDWDKLTCENIDKSFDCDDPAELLQKCLVNFGTKLGFRGNKEHTFLVINQFSKSVFKDGPLKGIPKYDVCIVDKTHQLSLTNDYVRDSAFQIPIIPGSFGGDLEKYFGLKHPNSTRFYTKPLSANQIIRNQKSPDFKFVRYSEKLAMGEFLSNIFHWLIILSFFITVINR